MSVIDIMTGEETNSIAEKMGYSEAEVNEEYVQVLLTLIEEGRFD